MVIFFSASLIDSLAITSIFFLFSEITSRASEVYSERVSPIPLIVFFNALKNYTIGKNLPPAWRILFDSSKSNNLYQFIYMALGVNAHVNNDLAFTLHDVVRNDSYQSDFNKVNTIIHQSLKEVIESLNEPSKLITLAEKSLLPLYTTFLDSLIKNWRNRTWINYKNLRDKKMNSEMVENVAEKIAQKLVKIKNISNFHKLSNVYLNEELYIN